VKTGLNMLYLKKHGGHVTLSTDIVGEPPFLGKDGDEGVSC